MKIKHYINKTITTEVHIETEVDIDITDHIDTILDGLDNGDLLEHLEVDGILDELYFKKPAGLIHSGMADDFMAKLENIPVQDLDEFLNKY